MAATVRIHRPGLLAKNLRQIEEGHPLPVQLPAGLNQQGVARLGSGMVAALGVSEEQFLVRQHLGTGVVLARLQEVHITDAIGRAGAGHEDR